MFSLLKNEVVHVLNLAGRAGHVNKSVSNLRNFYLLKEKKMLTIS